MTDNNENIPLEDEETKEGLLEGFRQSWHEAMTGQTLPIKLLWLELDSDELEELISQKGFLKRIHDLHEQFMRGEISQGKMAEILGINRVDLIHLLEALDLQVTNL